VPKCLRWRANVPPHSIIWLAVQAVRAVHHPGFAGRAGELGYAVLVAEGSAIVMSLIQTGKIEAIVGVSCLSVLERAFPYMEAAAIPGVAVPLLQDDCIDTTVEPRLGVGLHPPYQRRSDPPAGPRRAAR